MASHSRFSPTTPEPAAKAGQAAASRAAGRSRRKVADIGDLRGQWPALPAGTRRAAAGSAAGAPRNGPAGCQPRMAAITAKPAT